MSSSIDPEASLLDLIRRLWMARVVKPLTLVIMVMLVFATSVGTEAPQTLPLDKANNDAPAAVEKTAMPPLPLSLQVRSRLLQHKRITEAAMTSHNLTAAYFLGPLRSAGGLSAELPKTPKQG